MTKVETIMEMADAWMLARLQSSKSWSDVRIERDHLESAIEALAKDAARYKWITSHIVDGADMQPLEDAFAVFGDEKDSCTQAEFDAVIDAAMKGETP